MRFALMLTGLMLLTPGVNAQSDSLTRVGQRITYFNYLGSGVLAGKKGLGTTASFSTIHGIRYKALAIGLGTGYDDYNRANLSDPWGYSYYMRWKVVPVFISLSADFGKIRNNSLFIQVNGGHSFIRATKRENVNFVEDSDGGVMINPSLGYRISAGKYRIYIGGGYKLQRNQYRYNPSPWIWGGPSPRISVKETMQRLEAHIGFGWN